VAPDGLASRFVQADAVSQIAADLYSLVPAQFTAARDERARQAKADGQAEVASAVRKLSRPTVSAWVVNQLVRSRPEAMARLFGVADALAGAQRELDGDKLRELSAQRRQVIGDLMSEAAATAAAGGQRLTEATSAEVRATLEAAIADPHVGAAVQAGQLTRALAYAGLGEVDLTAALATPPPARARAAARPSAEPGPPPPGRAARTRTTAGSQPGAHLPEAGRARADDKKAAAARALEAAQTELQEAAAAAAAAASAVASLSEQRQFLHRRIEHLRTEIREADTQDAALARDEARAKRARDTAERALATARRRLEQARTRAEPG
jgi:hypothetical protein